MVIRKNQQSHYGSSPASTEYDPRNPYEAVASTNTVGPWTAGAETGAYAPFGGQGVPGALGYMDTGLTKKAATGGKTPDCPTGFTRNADGNCVQDVPATEDKWGRYMTAFEGQYTPPGAYDPAAITAGQGGRGMVGAVGPMGYDPFTYQGFEGAALTPQDYAGFQTTVDPFAAEGFVAPTGAEAAQDPGYQFRLKEGQRALQQSAAAKGMLRTGNTWKDLLRYGQEMGSSEYDKVYGRRLGEYQQDYQRQLQQNQMAYQRELSGYGTGIQAQQLGEGSRLSARQANLAQQAQQFGQGMGAWQQNQRAREIQYGQNLERAQFEAQLAEAGADREMEAQQLTQGAEERAYDKAYEEAFRRYGVDYQKFEADQAKRYRRKVELLELGLTGGR
jgi:hypothetical protein